MLCYQLMGLIFEVEDESWRKNINLSSSTNLPCSKFSMIHQDLVRSILLGLNVTSVGKSRCVSRPWRAILSDPDFIHAHFKHHSHDQEQLILLSRCHFLFTLTFGTGNPGSDGVLRKINLPDLKWVSVIGTCNGLALVMNDCEIKYLINPMTCEYTAINVPTWAIDSRICVCMHGLGYDKVTDDYKIVSLSYYDADFQHEYDNGDTFVDVYSTKMGCWRRLDSSPYDHSLPDNDSGVFVNGALHWLAGTVDECLSVIAAFNLTTEKFDELPLPEGPDRMDFVCSKLVVFGGCLCVLDDCHRDRLEVWMMKEYGVKESWTKFIIDSTEYFDAKPFCQLGNEETIVVVDGETLLVKNLKERTSRNLVFDGTPVGFQDGLSFRETLFSPNFNSSNEENQQTS